MSQDKKSTWIRMDMPHDAKHFFFFHSVVPAGVASSRHIVQCADVLRNQVKVRSNARCIILLDQCFTKTGMSNVYLPDASCWLIWWYDMLRLTTGTRPRCGSHRRSDAHRPIPAKRGHHKASKNRCVKVLHLRAPPMQITTDSKLPHRVVYKTNTRSPPDWCCNAVGVERLDGAIDVRTAPEANSETSGIQDEHN